MRRNRTDTSMDSFVDGILGNQGTSDQRDPPHSSQSLRERQDILSSKFSKIENGQNFTNSRLGQGSFSSSDAFDIQPNISTSRQLRESLKSLFGYALIFINFTFIVASMLLIMSGIVAHGNEAVRLCTPCGYIATLSLVFGIILWLFTIFGFMWIRQRQMVLLLVYVGFLVVLFIALLALIIAASLFDRDTRVSSMDPSMFFPAWMRGVNETKTGKNYDICSLQVRFNCSGFRDGCCVSGICYNESEPPEWVNEVCPSCPFSPPMNPVVCTDAIYSTVRKNLGGFLLISFFAMVLVVAGIIFALLSRSANRLITSNSV